MRRKRLQRLTRILPHRFAAPPNTVPRKTRVFVRVSRVKRILTGVTGAASLPPALSVRRWTVDAREIPAGLANT